jgi:hypothetical protein
MAATRMLTLVPDGRPPSLNVDFVHAVGAETDAGVAGSVACCTKNPWCALPRNHEPSTSPATLPG